LQFVDFKIKAACPTQKAPKFTQVKLHFSCPADSFWIQCRQENPQLDDLQAPYILKNAEDMTQKV
jgi:hypothetical protein